jgi:CheY-like chemotaxis protein
MTLLESGISTRPGGAGIGLRHAAGLARSAGGALALVSSERGARFELTWPSAHAEPPVSFSPVSRISAALAGARILIIEDDDAVIDLLDTALSARGANVVSVKRRTDLGKALATGTFDAALFDISPIQEDVAGALLAVQGSSPLARLIVISGSAESLPSLPEGCDPAWVRKPFEVAEIVRALAGR